MKDNFYAVILSGGSGERFWPLSTPDHPKQFLSVFGGKSLLRQSVERLKGLLPAENILIVTGKSLAKATYRELPELPRKNIILEPCRRDTAAAVATACAIMQIRFEIFHGIDLCQYFISNTLVAVENFTKSMRTKFQAGADIDVLAKRKTAQIITADQPAQLGVFLLQSQSNKSALGSIHSALAMATLCC